jgi:hypothetical protein
VKGLDPIWLTVIATVVAIDQWIGSGKVSLDHVFPGDWIPWIVGWAGFLGGILGFVLAALTTIISSKPGILINAPANVVKAVAMIAIVLTALFGFGGSAHAATLPKPRPAAASVDPLQKLMDDISNRDAAIVSNVIAAINEADSDAATLTNPNDATSFRDPIAHACYPAQVKFLQSLPQVQAIQAKAPYNLIVLFQRKRDLIAQIKAGLPAYLKVGCAALLKDEETILVQTLGLIGVSVGAGVLTGVFPAAAPITLPALTI